MCIFTDITTKKGEKCGLQCVIFISSPLATDEPSARVLLDELAQLIETPGGLKNCRDEKTNIWTANGQPVTKKATG